MVVLLLISLNHNHSNVYSVLDFVISVRVISIVLLAILLLYSSIVLLIMLGNVFLVVRLLTISAITLVSTV